MGFSRSSVLIWVVGIGMMACTISSSTSTDSMQTECGAIAKIPPVITLTDSATEEPICDATVVAECTDVDAGARLLAYGPSGRAVDASIAGCSYGAGLLQVHACYVFTVSISKPGYQSATLPNVEVRTSQHCPGPIPDPQRLTVALQPD